MRTLGLTKAERVVAVGVGLLPQAMPAHMIVFQGPTQGIFHQGNEQA